MKERGVTWTSYLNEKEEFWIRGLETSEYTWVKEKYSEIKHTNKEIIEVMRKENTEEIKGTGGGVNLGKTVAVSWTQEREIKDTNRMVERSSLSSSPQWSGMQRSSWEWGAREAWLGPEKGSQALLCSGWKKKKKGQQVQRLLSREDLADVIVIYL